MMALRRVTILNILLLLIAGIICLGSVAYSAPPHFDIWLDVPPNSFSEFPGVEEPFIVSLTPRSYYPLQAPTRQGQDYDIDYDFPEDQITYTRKIKHGYNLIPVTSGEEDFISHRISLSLASGMSEATRKSLLKAQNKKAGSIFSIQIPIKSRTFESLFGEGGAGLKVSGFRKITFSGRSTWTDKQQTALNRQSKFPSLNMEQVYRFDITGTIGSKISVKVSQDSRNDLPLANRLMLRYKGSEDDVLQTVEAGNTTLNLPSTQFLQYSTRVQGLFGLKATAKIADVEVTAIASQEKGSTESVEFKAGSSSQASRVVQDINYKKRMIYDLGRLPIDRAAGDTVPEDVNSYDFTPRNDNLGIPGDSILFSVVYLDDKPVNTADYAGRPIGICHIDPNDSLAADPNLEYRTEGQFMVVDPNDYYIQPTSYYIQFLSSSIATDDILAVYMEILRRPEIGTSYIDTVGDISGDTLLLKLIKPESHSKVNHHVWEYEWKNVYSIGSTNMDISGIEIDIYKGKPLNNQVGSDDPKEQEGINYLQIFGLDEYNESNVKIPDGKIDKNFYYIDASLGLLFFRNRHPFDSRISYVNNDNGDPVYLQDSVPELYNTTNYTTLNQSSKYYIAVTSQERGASNINLGSANIIEGSEIITDSKGNRLVVGEDYNINYLTGQITLLKDEYTDINSNLSITFETAPFFSLSKKTLLGTRLEYAPHRDFKIGTTLLYKSDKSTNRKPKIGEETSNILVWDFDFNYRFKNDLFTAMAGAIPFITSRADSYMQVSGEMAQSRPNPNVDGEVYIDDFEGAKDSYNLGIFRAGWRLASRPASLVDSLTGRARTEWWNPVDEYSVEEIWNREDAGTNIANALKVEFESVNQKKVITLVDGEPVQEIIDIDPEKSWGGFMRNIPKSVVSTLVNTQLLEMRIRGDVGIMHIDLGRITEDINGNGLSDTEDKNRNRVLDPGEDTGYDGLFDPDEFGYDETSNPDPAGDDFALNTQWKRNGTEGNGGTEAQDYKDGDPDRSGPDAEDADYDGFDNVNSYFSYKLDLSDSTQFEVPGTKNDYGWKTIRIPIRDLASVDTIVGAPLWTEIEFARIWFDSIPYGEHAVIEIASLELVSTTWADSLYVADSVRSGPVSFDVAVINDEIDAGYQSPPNVEGYYDVTQDITEKEQSLLLAFENLNAQVLVNSQDSGLVLAADTGLAVRKFYRANNYMGYGKLEAFVYGDIKPDDSLLFFFRVGSDKDAYYEYRTLLDTGWATSNFVKIDFAEISGLKARLLAEREDGSEALVKDEGKYRVKIKTSGADPTLTRIQYFSMGVINLDSSKAATGNVWVDELRLTDVRDEVGTAAKIGVSGNMTDLITYSFNYSTQDAFYRGVSASTKGGAANNLGSGQTKTNYSFSGSVKLDKFFPRSLQLSLPVSVNWSQSVSEPLLRSNTDITVPEDLKKEETSVSVSKGIRVSESFNKNTKNIIFAALLNKLKTSFNYNLSNGHSPTQPWYIRERFDGTANYNLSMRKVASFKPLGWMNLFKAPFGIGDTKLFLYPTRVDLKGTVSGSYSKSLNQDGANPTSISREFRGGMTVQYKVLESLQGTYSFNTTRDLKDPETVQLTLNPKTFKLGIEQRYDQSFSGSYSPRIFSFVTHSVDYSARYTDDYRVNRDSVFYHNAALRTTAGLSVTLKHQELIGSNKPGRGHRPTQTAKSSTMAKLYKIPLKGIRYITDAVKPVSVKMSNSESTTYPSLGDKAAMLFRLGLRDDPGVEQLATNTGVVRQAKSVTKSFDANSGVTLFYGIGTDVKYARSIRESFDSNPQRSTTETWPDLKFNLRSIKGLGFFGRFMNSLSPSSGYMRTKDMKRSTTVPWPSEEREQKSYTPLISVTINLARELRTTARYEKSNTQTLRYSQSTGELSSIVNSYSTGYSFTGSYSFRSPTGIKLPIFGRLKFQSTMSVQLDVAYRHTKDESAQGGDLQTYNVNSDKTNLNIRPSATYSFSSTVKGGLSARWTDDANKTTRTTRYTRELSIWVEMRF